LTDARASAEVQVRSQVSPLGICGGQSEVVLGRVFLRVLLSSSVIPRLLHTHISSTTVGPFSRS